MWGRLHWCVSIHLVYPKKSKMFSSIDHSHQYLSFLIKFNIRQKKKLKYNINSLTQKGSLVVKINVNIQVSETDSLRWTRIRRVKLRRSVFKCGKLKVLAKNRQTKIVIIVIIRDTCFRIAENCSVLSIFWPVKGVSKRMFIK